MIDIAISIVGALLAWLIIMLISVNLLGLVVRGFLWSPPPIDEFKDTALEEFVQQDVNKSQTANFVMTLIPSILAVVFYFALYYYWNIGLAVAAGLIMFSRLPDLLWEIKNGVKVTKTTGPKLGSLFAMEFLISIPLVWYSLNHWPS